ncbi:restriction endonuclease [Calycomorphotria hydatis]|uniref:Restriction endonuclease n=1 Tax=Calycomorphotria hydatis TaxID=2528027 RepID=A0A517TBQ2_9PLAN|nr:restriction endonuclease [Calycomorphotria hydatis]QDT65804.1 Restriction endonuclease [Calycomorphotria hydatis]
MVDTESDDDHGLIWEDEANSAVEQLLDAAELDEIRGVICLPSHYDDGFDFGTECSNIEELGEYLREVYDREWYSYVPFERGEAVFDNDSWGIVADYLGDADQILEFFVRHSAPEETESILTAEELIFDRTASKILRVSLEEINDELITYLAKHPHKMRDMPSRSFEELVAAMFRNQGYDVTLTPCTRDGGMDVIAVQRSGIGKAMIIVECKRYSEDHKVGVEVVRGLYGVLEKEKATRGVVVTTSYFTRDAKQFCDELPYRMGLADFEKLSSQLNVWKTEIGNTRDRLCR